MKFARVKSLGGGGVRKLSKAPKFLLQGSNKLENTRDSKDPKR